MAITILPEKPGLGAAFGTGLGQGLQDLAEQKMGELTQRQQRKRMETGIGLIQQGNIAEGLPMLPPYMLKNLFSGFRGRRRGQASKPANVFGGAPQQSAPAIDGQETPAGGQQKSIGDLFNLRKQLLSSIKKGQTQPEVMAEELTRRGMAPEEIGVLLGGELNDDIVRYFLDRTNNDPKKARSLAKKFGYKV